MQTNTALYFFNAAILQIRPRTHINCDATKWELCPPEVPANAKSMQQKGQHIFHISTKSSATLPSSVTMPFESETQAPPPGVAPQ